MVSKSPWGRGTETKRNVGQTTRGTMSAFAKTGRAKSKQFTEKSPGQREPGFKQKTARQTTAAMQGGPIPSGRGMADKGPRKDAKRQFTNAPGKKVF